MTVLRVKEPFSITSAGAPRGFAAGMLVDSSDPVVVGREHLFEEAEIYVSRTAAPRVETATAAPGERRTRSRAEKPAKPAKKAAAKKTSRKPAKKAAVSAAKPAAGTQTPATGSQAPQAAPEPASDATPGNGTTGEKL